MESGEKENEGEEVYKRGVGRFWHKINHVAIVVSDIGKSLAFYTDIIGMEQVFRPDFDRHGGWLSMGNVDLHLIKGRPAVHGDNDLIVGHVAIEVDSPNLDRVRIKLQELKYPYRKNVTVPNPSAGKGEVVDQIFLRDPDGYYVEFCACTELHDYAMKNIEENRLKLRDLKQTTQLLQYSRKMKEIAKDSKMALEKKLDNNLEVPDLENLEISKDIVVDEEKLANLLKRRKVYGDIVQGTDEQDLRRLLAFTRNRVPEVIEILEMRKLKAGYQTYVPPAFYDRDGNWVQPPSFKMQSPIISRKFH